MNGGIANYGDRLSFIMDIEEMVLIATSEEHGIKASKAGELFRQSETYKKLFEPNSTYYTNGYENIFDDFTAELKKAGEVK